MSKDPFKAVTGLGITGMFALIALHGEAFWRSALAAWEFLLKITSTAPIGVASFFGALTISTMLVIAMKRRLPPWRNAYLRSTFIETLAILVAIYISIQQVPGLPGLLFGVLAGFMSAYSAKIIMSIAEFISMQWAAITDAEKKP